MITVDIRTVATAKGDVMVYQLSNSHGAIVEVSALGAGITRVVVPDRNGNLADVALGYANIGDYAYDGPCMGKTPGRYANRIAAGHLVIDGTLHQLAINNGPNALHGGPEGFQNQVWESELTADKQVVFTLVSPDGDEHYPGELTARVTYTWTDDNTLRIDYYAVATERATVVNLTNHSYFNLGGHNSGSVLEHDLLMPCSRYLPTDDSLIPTGEMAAVADTPMDFTVAKPIGRDIRNDFPALRYGKGYDNCWIIDDDAPCVGGLRLAARLSHCGSGRVLNVFTDQPAAQVYTGNWLEGCPSGRDGATYHDYDGVAIECQGLPDAPNKPHFPSQLLRPDDDYRRTVLFSFTVTP